MSISGCEVEKLLRRAREARSAGDEDRERELITQILGPYFNWGRQIAYARIAGAEDRAADAEEIAGALLLRLVQVLQKKLEFDSSFHVVAAVNLRFAIADYWREREDARAAHADFAELEALAAPETLEEDDMHDALEPYLDGLTVRDQKIARERLVEDRAPAEIAERNGISRAALDTANSRLLAKMRANAPADVRNRHIRSA